MKVRVVLAAAVLLSAQVMADPELRGSVTDGAGGRRSSDGSLALVTAIAQPGGTRTVSAGTMTLYSGFLGAFALRPHTDTDADGCPDEFDTDNDDDGLADVDEITGESFAGLASTDPNRPDTDGDGSSDGSEAAAGSSPLDETMYLHFTQLLYDAVSGSCAITWQAHGGRSYRVYSVDNQKDGGSRALLGTVTASGGAGPWRLTSTNFVDKTAGGTVTRVYSLVVDP